MNDESVAERAHLPALDGLRAVAVFLVFQFHVYGVTTSFAHVNATAPVDSLLLKLAAPGWVGVDLFFVLSGFLITRILLDAKGGVGYFRAFYARRFLRIFPLYYGFLIALLLLASYRDSAYIAGFESITQYQAWFWVYLSNLPVSFPAAIDAPGFQPIHLWSLAIEEQFYLVWPLVVLLCSRRSLIAVCCVCIAASLAFRVAAALDDTSAWSGSLTSYYFTLAKLDTLAVGALIACFIAEPGLASRARVPIMCAGASALAVLVYLGVKHHGLPPQLDDVNTVGFSALALFFGSGVFLVATASAAAWQTRVFSGSTIRAVGLYSYAIYLFHPIVLGELSARVVENGGFPKWGGVYAPSILLFDVVSLSLTFALAWASWHLFESQILKLKRYVPYGSGSSALAHVDPPHRLESEAPAI